MLIIIKEGSTSDAVEDVLRFLRTCRVWPVVCKGAQRTTIGVADALPPSSEEAIQKMNVVETILSFSTPYQLTNRQFRREKTKVSVGNVEVGGERVVLMAGPCAIESEEQLLSVAPGLKGAGVSVLRGSAYKPRTSPYSFQGLGAEGIQIHAAAKKKHGMLIETEVMDVRDVTFVAEHVDILRVGSRNMQNFDLLKELGRCGRPVILKRGVSATIEEWLLSAEYLMAYGNHQIILCERGIRTFENATRSTLDLSSIPVLQQLTHLPIIVDPSHAAGRKEWVPALSLAAVAAGADGLLIEVHPNPSMASSDREQALEPRELIELIAKLRKVAEAVGRKL